MILTVTFGKGDIGPPIQQLVKLRLESERSLILADHETLPSQTQLEYYVWTVQALIAPQYNDPMSEVLMGAHRKR